MSRLHYKYDLYALEERALQFYYVWEKDDSQEARTGLFIGIRDLASAILNIRAKKDSKFNIDFEKTAYEYALYLFERIVFGKFRLIPKNGIRFPLQSYVKLNIRHIIHSKRDELSWQEMVGDLEFYAEDTSGLAELVDPNLTDVENTLINRNYYSNSIIRILNIYYPIEEIKRLLAISLDGLFSNQHLYVPESAPDDIKDFSIILVSTAKRLVRENCLFSSTNTKKSDLTKAMTSALRSTVFLSSVVNTNFFPKELLLSVDIDSLYRLTSTLGGKTIRIPTSREMDTLIGAVVAVSKLILNGKTIDKGVNESKQDYHLVFASHVNIQTVISKILESHNIFGPDKPSQPIINMLISSIKSLDTLFKHIEEKSKDAPVDSLLNQYCALSDSFAQFTDSLVKISSVVNKDNHEEARS